MRIDMRQGLILILIFISWNIQAQNTNLVDQKISWNPIEGAWGYEVLIREGEKEVFKNQVREAFIKFSLSPGKYEIKINVLNKFKKVVSSTDWKPLTILEALQPVIRDFSPKREFLKSSGDLTLKAEVFQAREDTSFFLKSEKGEMVPGRLKILKDETVELTFPMKDLNEGDYRLYARDASGLEDMAEAFPLTLLPIIKPQIKDAGIRNIQQRQVYNDIEIRGSNFEEGAQVMITRQGQEFSPYETLWKSPEKLLISIITGDRPPGRYSLKVTNPSGESDTKNNVFFMEEAPQLEEIRKIPPIDTLSLLGGYRIAFAVDQSHGESGVIPLGFILMARQDLVNSKFWQSPGLKPFGVELSVDSTHLDYRNASFVYSEFYIGLSVYYRLKLARGWSILPKLSSGVSNLRVTKDRIFGSSVQGDAGYSLGGGVSLQKQWESGLLTEGGFDFRYTRYTGGYFNSIRPWAAGGFRF